MTKTYGELMRYFKDNKIKYVPVYENPQPGETEAKMSYETNEGTWRFDSEANHYVKEQ